MAGSKADDKAVEKPAPYRGSVSDYADAGKSWTVQHKVAFPQEESRSSRRFNPAELPDPDIRDAAGLPPLPIPDFMIDEEYETLPPSGNYPLDHPARQASKDKVTADAKAKDDQRKAIESDDRGGSDPEAPVVAGDANATPKTGA